MNALIEDSREPLETDIRRSMAVRRWLLILAVPVVLIYTVVSFDRFRILAEKNFEIDGESCTVQIRKHHSNVFVRILDPNGESRMRFFGDANRQLSKGEKADILFDEKN